jgi:hypothetical protein
MRNGAGKDWAAEMASSESDIAEKLVANFPFGIFYSVEGTRIVISAVLDLRQDPDRIRERLEE